jgi:hypothetical protein
VQDLTKKCVFVSDYHAVMLLLLSSDATAQTAQFHAYYIEHIAATHLAERFIGSDGRYIVRVIVLQ